MFFFFHRDDFVLIQEAVRNWVFELEKFSSRARKVINIKVKTRLNELHKYLTPPNETKYNAPKTEFWKSFHYYIKTEDRYKNIKCEWSLEEIKKINNTNYLFEWDKNLTDTYKIIILQRDTFVDSIVNGQKRRADEGWKEFRDRKSEFIDIEIIKDYAMKKYPYEMEDYTAQINMIGQIQNNK